jgi:ABC-type branched-subunit amino acid transport system ATPase component
VRAVDDLTFAVEPRKGTGFLAPNGAGNVDIDAVDATARARRYVDFPAPCGA